MSDVFLWYFQIFNYLLVLKKNLGVKIYIFFLNIFLISWNLKKQVVSKTRVNRKQVVTVKVVSRNFAWSKRTATTPICTTVMSITIVTVVSIRFNIAPMVSSGVRTRPSLALAIGHWAQRLTMVSIVVTRKCKKTTDK